MKKNIEKLKVIAIVALVFGMIIPFNLSSVVMHASAASITKEEQLEAGPVIALENGDFEDPEVTSSKKWQLFDAAIVPGWETTATDNEIEILQNGFSQDKGLPPVTTDFGAQWAEINANEVAALYQDIPTTPGTKIHWQVYHKGRQGVDTAVVEFGSPDGTMVQQAEMVDGNTAWGLYTGSYIIPENQTTTRFQFRSVDAAGGNQGIGNFIDNILFATRSILEVSGSFSKPSIQVDGEVNYHIQATNYGGMPADNNVFAVQIPMELNYSPGSLTSTDTTISEESYNKETRTLTFKTDRIKKDISVNIIIPLVGKMVTPAATPDTNVSYNDENFLDETYTLKGKDSSVEITSNEMPVITGDTSTTLQPGDMFDSMSSIVATDKEDGDLTDAVLVTSNPVDTNVPGTYQVTYEVTDSDNNTATFTRVVVVEEAPTINGENETDLNPGDAFNPMSTITAMDKEDGNLTSEVNVTNNPVDTNVPGSYEVTYEVTDSDGNTATFIRTVIVTGAPTITGKTEIHLNSGDVFNPMTDLTAYDKEDGDLTESIQVVSNNVDVNNPGIYQVVYKVTDTDGNVATFTRTVIVASTMPPNDGGNFDSDNLSRDIIIQPSISKETDRVKEKTTEIAKQNKMILPATGDHSPITTVGIGLLLVTISIGGLFLQKQK